MILFAAHSLPPSALPPHIQALATAPKPRFVKLCFWEQVTAARVEFAASEVVTAAAGLDTRSLRLPCLAGGAATVFECDYEEVVCCLRCMIDL